MVCRLMFEVTRLHVGGCVVESRRLFANRIDLGRTFRVIQIDKQLLRASYRWSGVMCYPECSNIKTQNHRVGRNCNYKWSVDAVEVTVCKVI
jgi:hypothetical protein